MPAPTDTPETDAVSIPATIEPGDPETLILAVPFRSQYDGSPYQYANCGPAALGMILEAYGISMTTEELRALANQIQGTTSTDAGVSLEVLDLIARRAGLRTEGLQSPDGSPRRWSIADIIRTVRQGYPVIILVHFAALPDHAGAKSPSDHYVVVVGVTRDGFIINDPAFPGSAGAHRLLRPADLINAWQEAVPPQQADAFLPPEGHPNLALLSLPGRPAAVAVPGSPTEQDLPARVAATPAARRATGDNRILASTTPSDDRIAVWALALGQWKHTRAPIPSTTPARQMDDPENSASPSESDAAATVSVAAIIGVACLLILLLPRAGRPGEERVHRRRQLGSRSTAPVPRVLATPRPLSLQVKRRPRRLISA